MRDALPEEARSLAMDPPAAELIALARPYVGPATSNLIVLTTAKLVDFLRRGAGGAISVAGVNCAVGAVTSALIPSIRADYAMAPAISLVYGGGEGPADRMRLETFVQLVKARSQPAVA